MNAQQQLQLEDAQEKLSVFRKHLDLLARCTGESKDVDPNEVLSAVAEIQSLVQWAAQRPELGEESAVLLVKLQELHEIRENLERTSAAVEECSSPALISTDEITIPDKSESYSKDLEYIPDIVGVDVHDDNGENLEEDTISMDKDSLGDYSFSTEDPNVANAESPQSIEDTNVDIPIDDKTDEAVNVEERDDTDLSNEKKDVVSNTEAFLENTEVEVSVTKNNTEVLESSSVALKSSNASVPDTNSPNLLRNEIIIIETDEDSKTTEWVNDPKNSNDPLDVCMYAIRNLYESLKVKENELLKLSTMQNDQKHIEALQAVIIEFHKDITNLNGELEKSKKENSMLKEQVLELEEAENDARLEAQKLEQKLVFLQEKDSHSQAELTQLKQNLKKTTESLAEKEALEKELRSQIKYMETLAQKYEDQIKVMESKEIASSKRDLENSQKEGNDSMTSDEKRSTCTKGTQTYEPSQTKINCTPSESKKNSLATENGQDIEEPKEILDKIIEDNGPKICPDSSTLANEVAQSTGNISQQELLKRLHRLIDEDVSLQQQIHYVDEINLAMWKKLQNLDNHIGECKRQNINETNPSASESESNSAGCEISNANTQELSTISSIPNIPEKNISSLDQNEKYIQERLVKLEEINASFEKELKNRENLCQEKEKRYEEWAETEKRITDDLKRLADEKDWITDQISKLNAEKEVRQAAVERLEEEVNTLKEKNQSEITKIRLDQETTLGPLTDKVNQMLLKEKEILKMITNLKTEKNRSEGKRELERLKCNYIELQLELSQARDEMRKIEEKFQLQIVQCASKHLLEENPIVSELERLRSENTRTDKMISNLQIKQKDLLNALDKQEQYLQNTKESYKKNLEEAEEEHRSVESELKNQLEMIEEGTAIATAALMEERLKVEKELKGNIEDLMAKEEMYKAKIMDLERDVSHLHEELRKIASESESEKEVAKIQESIVKEVKENIIEQSCSSTNLQEATQTASQPDSLISPKENAVKEPTPPPTMKVKNVNSFQGKKIQNNLKEDNVDELRAQVRELQNELEMKISADEIPPVQPVTPITAKSLKMQKVEDLDYAEVDECSLNAWRKNMQNQNIPEPKAVPANVQAVYGDKYSTGYKDTLQNQKLVVNEPVEENDYDEVLPRPTNFHVVQQVGSDTLLVGWNYVNPSVLEGFEVYLGDQVHERIYIPDRTKALISGLNLRKPIRLSIYALSRYGQMSEPAVLEISSTQDFHTQYFEDEEYRDIEDPKERNQRPYSMEW